MAFKNSLKSSTSPPNFSIIGTMYLLPDCFPCVASLILACGISICLASSLWEISFSTNRIFTHRLNSARFFILLFFNFHSPSFSVIRYFFLYHCYKITYPVIEIRDIMASVLLVHFDYISYFGYCQFILGYFISVFEYRRSFFWILLAND